MKRDRQAAALDRLRQKGLGLAPHMVDGKPKRPSTAQRGAGRAQAAAQGTSDTSTRPEKTSPAASAIPGSVFELLIPAPAEFLNENQRLNRYEKARRVKAWRFAAAMHARRKGMPTGLARVRIDAHVVKPVANNYDPSNYAPTSKACLDGLIDAGLSVDDNRHHVEGPFMHDGGQGDPALIVVVTTLQANVTAA